MTAFPTDGQTPWSIALKAYIDGIAGGPPFDMTGAVAGMFLTVDTDGVHIVPITIDPTPAPPQTLDDLTDVAIGTPADGTCLIYSANAGGWINSPSFLANLVLAAGASVPAGTPPCLVWDLPTSVILSHTMEGTNGAAVSAASEGATSFTGAATTYTNAQHAVGATCIPVTAGNTGYLADTGLGLAVAVQNLWVRFPATPSGNVNFGEMRTSSASLGALQRATAGTVNLKNGSGTTTATTSTVLAVDTWYRYEWMLGNSSQTLRIYDASNNLLEEKTGAATSGTVDTVRWGITSNLNGGLFMDSGKLAAYWMGS